MESNSNQKGNSSPVKLQMSYDTLIVMMTIGFVVTCNNMYASAPAASREGGTAALSRTFSSSSFTSET